jgi:hypothetical protein
LLVYRKFTDDTSILPVIRWKIHSVLPWAMGAGTR